MDKLEFGDGLYQVRNIEKLYTGSRAPRSFPYNENTLFQADGRVLVEYPIFDNIDGNAWSLICLMSTPTQRSNIFGEKVMRSRGGMMNSRYAPKAGTEDEMRGWLMEDVRKLTVKVEQQVLDYRLDHQREMAKDAAQKFMDIAQTATHPFEIYRNLYAISHILHTPREGEPGYLPHEIANECALVYQKLRKVFLREREKVGGACDDLNPQLIPIERLKFGSIPDSVPGAVYKSLSPPLSKAKVIVPASRTTFAEFSRSSEESNLTIVAAWTKDTKKDQVSTNKVAPKLASESSTWFSAATTTSHKPASKLASDANVWLAKARKLVVPNTSTPTTVKSSLECISSKIMPSAMGFDGHVTLAGSEKTEPVVLVSAKPRPLAGNEDFFGPAEPRKVSVVGMPNQASTNIIGALSVEVKSPRLSDLATGSDSFVPAKPRIASDGHISSGSEKVESVVAVSMKPRPLASNEDFFGPAKLRKISVTDMPKVSAMPNQTSTKNIGDPSAEVKNLRLSTLATSSDFFVPAKLRMASMADSASNIIGGPSVEVKHSYVPVADKERSAQSATLPAKTSPAARSADYNESSMSTLGPRDAPVVEEETSKKPATIRVVSASSDQSSGKIVNAIPVPPKAPSVFKLADPQDFLSSIFESRDSTTTSKETSNKAAATHVASPSHRNSESTSSAKEPPHLADPEPFASVFERPSIHAKEVPAVLKDITNYPPGNKAPSIQNSEETVVAKTVSKTRLAGPSEFFEESKTVSKRRLAEANEFFAAAKKFQGIDGTVVPAAPSVAKIIASPAEVKGPTDLRKGLGAPSAKAAADESKSKKVSVAACHTSRLASAENFLAAIKKPASSKFSSTVNKLSASGSNISKSAFGNVSVDHTTVDKTPAQNAVADETSVHSPIDTAPFTVASPEVQASYVAIEGATEKPAVHEPLAIDTPSPKEDAIAVSTTSAHKTPAVPSLDIIPTIKFASTAEFVSWISGGASLKVEIATSPIFANLTGINFSFSGPSSSAAAPVNTFDILGKLAPSAAAPVNTSAIPEQLDGEKIKSEAFSTHLSSSEHAISEQEASLKSEQAKIKAESSSAAVPSEIYAASELKVSPNVNFDHAEPRGINSPVTEKNYINSTLFKASDFDTWMAKTKPIVRKVAPTVVQPRTQGTSPSAEPPAPIPMYITEHAPYYDFVRSPESNAHDTEQALNDKSNPNSKSNSPIVSGAGLEIVTSSEDGEHRRSPTFVKPQPRTGPEAKARVEFWANEVSKLERKKVNIKDEKFSSPPCKNPKYKPIQYKAHIIALDQFLDEFDHGVTIPASDSDPVTIDFNVRNNNALYLVIHDRRHQARKGALAYE